MNKLINKESYVMIYYGLLLVSLIFIFRANGITTAGRVLFLGMTLLPAVVMPRIIPFALIAFYGISDNSFFPVLPTESYYYLAISVLLLFLSDRRRLSEYVFLFLYFLVIDTIHLDWGNQHFFWLIIAFIFGGFFVTDNDLDYAAISFVIVSLFLSVEYLVFRGQFVEQFGTYTLGLERASWTNPNAFGGMIALGSSLAVGMLTGVVKVCDNLIYKIICLFTLVVAILVLIMNASKGSLITLSVASFFYIIIPNRLNITTKCIIIGLAVVAGIHLMTSSISELLLYRMADEEAMRTGTGRTIIWEESINTFLSSDLFTLLFGTGYSSMLDITFFHRSTHNDFVTSIIAYGFIGFIVFISLLIKPIINAPKSRKLIIAAMLLPVFLESMVLEPIFRGYLLYLTYFFFIVAYSSKKINWSND